MSCLFCILFKFCVVYYVNMSFMLIMLTKIVILLKNLKLLWKALYFTHFSCGICYIIFFSFFIIWAPYQIFHYFPKIYVRLQACNWKLTSKRSVAFKQLCWEIGGSWHFSKVLLVCASSQEANGKCQSRGKTPATPSFIWSWPFPHLPIIHEASLN